MLTSFGKTMCNFSFRGRATRKEFLSYIIMWLLISLLFATIILASMITVLGMRFDFASGQIILAHKMGNLAVVPFIFMVVMSSAFIAFEVWSFVMGSLLSIRRLHDVNYSGVCYWVWLSAFILFNVSEASILTGFLFYLLLGTIIVLCIAKSFPSTNKYGKVDIDELLLNIKQHG